MLGADAGPVFEQPLQMEWADSHLLGQLCQGQGREIGGLVLLLLMFSIDEVQGLLNQLEMIFNSTIGHVVRHWHRVVRVCGAQWPVTTGILRCRVDLNWKSM